MCIRDRVRAGHRIAYEPKAVVRHRHSATADSSSPAFAVWNLRNHLLTLVRNAPAALVARELARFAAVTAADLRLLGRPGIVAQHLSLIHI